MSSNCGKNHVRFREARSWEPAELREGSNVAVRLPPSVGQVIRNQSLRAACAENPDTRVLCRSRRQRHEVQA